MLHKKIDPSGILKQFVDYYCIMESDSKLDFFPKTRIYTYGAIVLVFHYKNPSRFQKRDELPEIEPRTVICGQQTSYYDLSLAGKTGMIFVVFQPFGAGLFFKMPMNELTNQNVSFELLVKNESPEIEDKIANANTTQERVAIIENFLIRKLTRNYQNYGQIISIFRDIRSSRGLISVNQLAESSCLSIKQFERKFSEIVGLNPKQYLRIMRFQNSVQMKKNNNFENYTTMAFDCGYYDQPHFIRDFKIITGLSPKRFFETQIQVF